MEENVSKSNIALGFFLTVSLNLFAQETLQEVYYSENEPPLRIAVISDMNGDYGDSSYSIRVHKAVERIQKLKPDAVLVTGDMASGEKKGLDYKAMWKGFRDTVTLPLIQSNIPMLVSPGNHDASAWKGFELERKIYKDEWTTYLGDYLSKNSTVKLISMDNYPFHYSFVIKNVFFMAIDATTQLELSSLQKNWLIEQSKNAQTYAHKVVFSHYPFHPLAINRENDFIADKGNVLFKNLKQNGVNLFLSGHQHAYYPAVWEGVRFIGQACLGGGPRKIIGTSKVSQYSFTIVDFESQIKVDAYPYPNFEIPVERTSLPTSLKTPKGGSLIRDDLQLKSNYKIGKITLNAPL
jgi:3',5'-cyclic AMP phosphodiesterase CpdA